MKTFRVKLSDWIEANGKIIPKWDVVGDRNGMIVHGKIVDYCDYEFEDWFKGDKYITEGVQIKHNMMPFKCPISSVSVLLPISFLYEKEALRNSKIDDIIN